MKTAVFILARKDSKRIPNKNIKEFNGIPLILYTLNTAKKLDIKTIVSSDSPEIKNIVKSFYPNFIFIDKKPEYAQDRHDTSNELKYLNS